MWNVYLSGEIHSDWREQIQKGTEDAGLDIEFSGPVTDHEKSDDVWGSDIWQRGSAVLARSDSREN